MAWFGGLFSGSNGSGGSEMVGQNVELGQQHLRIKKVLAEGINSFYNTFYVKIIKSNLKNFLNSLKLMDLS